MSLYLPKRKMTSRSVPSYLKPAFSSARQPPISLLVGHADFTNRFWVLRGSVPGNGTLEDAKAAGATTVNYGAPVVNYATPVFTPRRVTYYTPGVIYP